MTTRSGKRLHNQDEDVEIVPVSGETQIAKRMKTTIPRIFDGKYFSILSNDHGKISARCNECAETKKGHITSTGNFKIHYKMRHPAIASKLDEYLQNKTDVPSKLQQPTLKNFTSNINTETVIIQRTYIYLKTFMRDLLISIDPFLFFSPQAHERFSELRS